MAGTAMSFEYEGGYRLIIKNNKKCNRLQFLYRIASLWENVAVT